MRPRTPRHAAFALTAFALAPAACAGAPPPPTPTPTTVELPAVPTPPATASAQSAPELPSLPAPHTPRGVLEIDARGNATCALLRDGAVQCLRSGDPRDVPGLSDAVHIAVGGGFGCAVTKDGKVDCWGYNHHGALGVANAQPADASNNRPAAPVPGVERAIAVAAAEEHACALIGDGSVWCWGGNRNGQLGRADRTDGMAPARLPGISGVAELALTYFGTCARTRAGQVLCTNGSPGSFDELAPLRGARRLVAGHHDLCAILADDVLRCWIGRPKGNAVEFKGRAIDGLPKARKVSLDELDGHGCAIDPDGKVVCWGHNVAGQLGACTPKKGDYYESSKPLVVAGVEGAVDVVAARDRTCALMPDATVRCWGYNAKGELGNGVRWAERVPTPVVTPFDGPAPPLCVSPRMRYEGNVKGLAWGPSSLTMRLQAFADDRTTCVEVDLAAGEAKAAVCPADLASPGKPEDTWTTADGATIVYGPGPYDPELKRTVPGEKRPSATLRLADKVGLLGQARGDDLVLVVATTERPTVSSRSAVPEARIGDVLVLDAKTLKVKRHVAPPLCAKPEPLPPACP